MEQKLEGHLVPGLYAPNGCMAASGSALNWFAANLKLDEPGESPHRGFDQLAASVPPGSDGMICLPYFLGEKTPIQDPLARGTFTAVFFVQCMEAIGCKTIHLEDT